MDNRLMGEVAATGLFLSENGEVRPMQEIKLAVQETGTQNEGIFEARRELEPRFFLKQMIAQREEEIHTLARLRLSGKEKDEKNNLLEILFPDWQKEKGLPSVEQRRRDRLLS